MDKELTSLLKEFAEILVHGESKSEQFFEYIEYCFVFPIAFSWKNAC